MARRPFRTPEALIVVSSDGYFDVFPPNDRRLPNAKPAYRGAIAELGSSVRGDDGHLSVRPDSVALDAAVSVWSRKNGAAAVSGGMGAGRNETRNPTPVAAPAPKGEKSAAKGEKSAAKSETAHETAAVAS